LALLEVANVAFGFTSEALVRDVTFRLETGDRVGLVAPNGTGKTTLLRLIAGELTPDSGSVLVAKGAALGYYRQSDDVGTEGSVRDTLRRGFAPLVALAAELRAAEVAAASGAPEALQHLATVTERFHAAGAEELDRRLETIATRLGFAAADLERPTRSLSGGERGRLALGVVLAGQPDVLLLDEPTNHLDLESINALNIALQKFQGTVLLVTHDHDVIDEVATRIWHFDHGKIEDFKGPYEEYLGHAKQTVG
jgi:ATP-binding cassette subfamily F protein 3